MFIKYRKSNFIQSELNQMHKLTEHKQTTIHHFHFTLSMLIFDHFL